MTKSTIPGADAATDERALFEVWADGKMFLDITSVTHKTTMYKEARTNYAWLAWQARAALAAGAPVEPTANELRAEFAALQFNAQRLRNVVKLLGMESEVPKSDAGLDGARGAVLGQIAAKLRTPAATGAGSQVEQDAARLEFLMEREAWIAWSKDGESCRLFHRSDDGEPMPMLGWGARHWSHDPREAIDAAMQALATPKEG